MRHYRLWVLLTLVLAALPSLLHLPLWVGGIALAGAALHFFPSVGRGGRGKLIAALLLAATAAGIWFSFGAWFSGDAILSFFVAVVFLKWAESASRRDYLLLIFAAVILAAVGALYWENLFSLLHMLVVVFALTVSLVAIHMDPAASAGTFLVKRAALLVVLALPLMVLLFTTFPRIPGPLWDIGLAFGLPVKALMDRGAGEFGKVKTLQPGGIQRAKAENENVLVAEFKGAVPFKSRLYWRGPVFWDFDGTAWSLPENWDNRTRLLKGSIKSKKRLDRELKFKDDRVRYTLRVMPNGGRWLYGLEVPASGGPEAFISSDFQLLSIRRIDDHEPKLDMAAYLEFRAGAKLTPEQRKKALAWPEGTNPRLLALGRELKEKNSGTDEILHEVLSRLASGGYGFDNSHVPEPGPDMLDRFFFDGKRGGAEILAGSVAMLMRAAGVPSRLIGGFRGGTIVALTNFVIVKQADAHAWLEIWNDGWQRVEPKDIVQPPDKKKADTKAAAPKPDTGVEIKKEEAAPAPLPGKSLAPGKKTPPKKERSSFDLPAWASFFSTMEKWVINYDPDRQMDILKGVGMAESNWLDLLMAGGAGVAVILGLYLCTALWMGRRRADPLTLIWERFCRKMGKLGVEKAVWECPGDYLARICRERPEMASAAEDIVLRYLDLRYGRGSDSGALPLFRRQVQRFLAMA